MTALRIGIPPTDFARKSTEHRVAATVELRRLVRIVRQAREVEKLGYPVVGYWRTAFGSLRRREEHAYAFWMTRPEVR